MFLFLWTPSRQRQSHRIQILELEGAPQTISDLVTPTLCPGWEQPKASLTNILPSFS